MSMAKMCAQSCPTLCDPVDYSPARLLCPWNSPVKNTGVDCHILLQGIFPTQRWNTSLLHCRQILYHLSHKRTPTWEAPKKHTMIKLPSLM